MATLGEHLIGAVLPAEYRSSGPLDKGALNRALVDLAKKEPARYPKIVADLKRLGDEVSTLEGVSVGLDDVGPDKKRRDEVMDPFAKRFRAAKDDSDKEKILIEAQGALVNYAKGHAGTMGEMVRSGGRGSLGQLVKIVGAPVLARDEKNRPTPWLIPRSYAEGLKPADSWVAANEARLDAVRSNISVVEPGDLNKILINNMSDKLVTSPDCGTTNGLAMSPTDPSIIDRHLARDAGGFKAGTLVTPQVAGQLKRLESVIVRSPMTCQAAHGICQKCQGLDPSGRIHPIGTNVGMRAAQALAEPLTQFALSAKHGGALSKGGDVEPRLEGIKGVRQALEIPESFLHQATLAERDGSVSKIEPAPQGGNYVWIGEERHYVGPSLRVTAVVGQKVEAGDALSNGVPRPDEIVRHKGLGEGRRHLVDLLHGVYKDAGVDVDKRHLETLARSVLNHVVITDAGEDDDHGFIKGDIVNYNRFQHALASAQKKVPLAESVGETLAADALHFTAGTRITDHVRSTLAKQGIQNVVVAPLGPHAEPFMRSASRTPLLNPNWMQRLAHRYLKESLVAGAHRGDVAETHGYDPAAAYAAGGEFGQGAEGRY